MRRAAASLAIAVAGWLPQAAFALSGHITNISGVVVARHADGSQRILSVRSEVKEGDLLVTAENSYARVKFTDGGEVVLRPGTQVKIDAYRYEEAKPEGDGFAMSLLKGGLRSVTGALARRNPERATYATPTATIGIRGTHFGALFCADDCIQVPAPGGSPPANGLHVDVADGRIVVSNPAGAQEFAVGQFGYVASRATIPATVPSGQGIRAALPQQAVVARLGGGLGKSGDLECAIR